MKKTIEFKEVVTYWHHIDVEIEPKQEDDFETFVGEVDEDVEEHNGEYYYDRGDIAEKFAKRYGDSRVTFNEDGSPEVEFEFI